MMKKFKDIHNLEADLRVSRKMLLGKKPRVKSKGKTRDQKKID